MTLQEIGQMLKATGFPVAYSHFQNPPPSIPFICYVVAYSSNFFADDKVHKKIETVQIELYTAKKDPQAESVLESVLDSYGLAYETTETYLESEKLYQKIYEVGVI